MYIAGRWVSLALATTIFILWAVAVAVFLPAMTRLNLR